MNASIQPMSLPEKSSFDLSLYWKYLFELLLGSGDSLFEITAAEHDSTKVYPVKNQINY